MSETFGIAVSPGTISTLRLVGIVPLAVAIALSFKLKQNKGMALILAWVVYLSYQGGVALFVHPIA